MDAVKYLKERRRMCEKIKAKAGCYGCPIYALRKEEELSCVDWQENFPEKAVEIVEKWSKENPQKTILQDFLEKYPNAKLSEGIPKSCCHFLGYPQPNECEFKKCRDCWNRPLESEV